MHQFAIGLDDQTYPGTHAFKPDFGLGVVYSQAKDGKQARLVSNAQIKKNKPLYLPTAWSNAPEDSGIPGAGCAVGADKVLNLTNAR